MFIHSDVLFQYDCFSAPLKFNGINQSWWYDKNGVRQFYWTGSDASTHMCQCGIDGNCIDPSLHCNCDSIFPSNLTDAGNFNFIFVYGY